MSLAGRCAVVPLAWRFVNDYDPDLMIQARTYLNKYEGESK